MGLTIVPLGQESGGTVLRTLRQGGLVGLLCDRDIVGNGVEVEFFGEKTTFPAGPATLALRTGAALVAAAVYSGPGRSHTGVISAPFDTGRTGRLRQDVARITQAIADEFEQLIRRAPEQWHMYQPNWPSDRQRSRDRRRQRRRSPLAGNRPGRTIAMRVAMVCPYSLSRPGGVQGQAVGLAGALRAVGHDVVVVAPDDDHPAGPIDRTTFSVGRTWAIRSNGSVAPVSLSPRAAARARSFVRDYAPTSSISTSRWRRWSATAALWTARRRPSVRTTGPAPVGPTARSARSPGGPIGNWRPAVRCPTPPATPSGPRPAPTTTSSSTVSTSSGSLTRHRGRPMGRRCCSSAATSHARGSTYCSTPSPASPIRPSCGSRATVRLPTAPAPPPGIGPRPLVGSVDRRRGRLPAGRRRRALRAVARR